MKKNGSLFCAVALFLGLSSCEKHEMKKEMPKKQEAPKEAKPAQKNNTKKQSSY